MLLLAGMFVLGIQWRATEWRVFLPVAILFVLSAMPWKERGLRSVLFAAGLPLLFFVGSIQMQHSLQFRQNYMDKLTDGQEVQLAGKIARIETKPKCIYYYLTGCSVRAEGKIYPCNDVIAYDSSSGHSVGQILTVTGTISHFTEPLNEGMFDSRQFYQSQKIDFGVWVTKTERVQGGGSRYYRILQHIKERTKKILKQSVREDGVLAAMLLGEKTDLDEEIKTLYQRAGISHILAISGLHVSLLGLGLYGILRKRMHLRYLTAAMTTVLFLVSYAWMSGNGVSTRRAVGMCVLFLLADVFGYAYDLLSALALVLLVMLWENPFLLGYSGFLFSVVAVLGIGVGGAVFTEWQKLGEKEREQTRVSPIQDFFRKQKNGLWVSLSIQLFTLPLVAWNYYEIPVYAMLVNFVVLALVEVLLGLAVAGTAISMVHMGIGYLLLKPCDWLLQFYRVLCEAATRLPGAQFITGKPGLWQICFYYAGLFLLLLVLHGKVNRTLRTEKSEEERKGNGKGRLALFLSFALLLLLLFFPAKTEFEIDFLDVGQGDGIYLCTGDGVQMFFDGGSTDIKKVGQYRILPFLKAKGVRKISYWFVSHTDADHISGLEEVLQSDYKVEYLIFAKASQKEEKTRALAALAKEKGCQIRYMEADETLSCGQAGIRCLYPEKEEKSEDCNERCLVLQYEEGNVRAVFGGDISENTEEKLVRSKRCEPVDILKANHHGSRFSNGTEFLNCIKPRITVASAGKKNRYGHPSAEAVARIKDSGSMFVGTVEHGRIRIRIRDKKLVWEPFVK